MIERIRVLKTPEMQQDREVREAVVRIVVPTLQAIREACGPVVNLDDQSWRPHEFRSTTLCKGACDFCGRVRDWVWHR